MTANRDMRIWDIAAGKQVRITIDDSNVPSLPKTTQSRGANRLLSPRDELKEFEIDPRFDVNLFAEFIEKVRHLDIRVLAGIMPIKSAKMALYMNNNIPGIEVPEAIIKRIEQADDILEESVTISSEIIQGLRNMCAGIHIMAPGWETNIPMLVERSGLAI